MTTSRVAHLCAVLVLAFVGVASAQQQEGTDIPVRTTQNTYETKPSGSTRYLAWSQTTQRHPNRTNVFVKPRGQKAFRVNAAGTQGSTGSVDGNRLAYQQFGGRQSSIRIMNLTTRRSSAVGKANTRRWEFWPRIDGQWLMFGRVVGRQQKLILLNLKSGSDRVLDSVSVNAYLLPGQVNGDFAVWNVLTDGNKAKVKRHRISTRNTATLPNGGRHNWGPSVTGRGTTYFGRSNNLCGGNAGLFRWTPSGGVSQLVSFPAGEDMGTSFVYRTGEGKIVVLHDLAKCSGSTVTKADIYKVIDPFTVTLTAVVESNGNSTGTVTGPGIDCGAECTQDFEPGSSVTLTATPAEGDTFDGWSEASCGTEPTCTITVSADTTVTATFRP